MGDAATTSTACCGYPDVADGCSPVGWRADERWRDQDVHRRTDNDTDTALHHTKQQIRGLVRGPGRNHDQCQGPTQTPLSPNRRHRPNSMPANTETNSADTGSGKTATATNANPIPLRTAAICCTSPITER